ncbi:MAG: YidB family protein [Burkholderiaceae bacterium]
MSNRMPNLTALLGLLAVVGYQNRDKIGAMIDKAQEALAGATGGAGRAQPAETAKEIGTVFGRSGGGDSLSGGLGELIDRFRNAGESETVDSWVRPGPNRPVSGASLERALGPSLIEELSVKTGLDPQEILSRLSNDLPRAVDDFTPDGRLPSAQEASRLW